MTAPECWSRIAACVLLVVLSLGIVAGATDDNACPTGCTCSLKSVRCMNPFVPKLPADSKQMCVTTEIIWGEK